MEDEWMYSETEHGDITHFLWCFGNRKNKYFITKTGDLNIYACWYNSIFQKSFNSLQEAKNYVNQLINERK